MAIVELNHPLQMKHVKVHPMNLILTSWALGRSHSAQY